MQRPTPRAAVLFLCVANSARSQMAEALARALAPPGVAVLSAGSEPSTVHPCAQRALAQVGLSVEGQRSKSVRDIEGERVRFAITLCADEVCPAFFAGEAPGEVVRLHWPHPDPVAAGGDDEAQLAAFAAVRDRLHERIVAFFADPSLFPRSGPTVAPGGGTNAP